MSFLTSNIPISRTRPASSVQSSKQQVIAARSQPLRSSATEQLSTLAPELPTVQGSPNVVILGGSGRVGSSTAVALKKAVPAANIAIGCRTEESFRQLKVTRQELESPEFKKCDVEDIVSITAAIKGADLVIHCAGPFQRRSNCNVLEAAISAGVPYLDVCDDTEYALRAKSFHQKAIDAGVPAITTAGIYPGVSNIMAAHMVSIAREEYDDNWRLIDRNNDNNSNGDKIASPKRILYSYFTAGTGGAGPTILETSLLLAGEKCTVYKDGQPVVVPSVSNRRGVDFGPGVGRRSVYLYPLPEVETGRRTFKVPSISARFGTAPEYWNWGMVAAARLIPKSILSNRDAVKGIGQMLGPLVKAVDGSVGEKVAMLVEVELDNGQTPAGLYVHKQLSVSVGVATAAFARCMLAGQTQPGVWWPEERGALESRRALLTAASDGAAKFVLNKPAWAFESDPIKIGLGFYL